MVSIIRATEKDYKTIVNIGKVSVAEAHRESCSAEELTEFIETKYSDKAIREELNNPINIYHIINYNKKAVGFSKIILNTKHPNIGEENVAKLDRIYLLNEFHGLKLGSALLNFNIELSESNSQSGIWLFTWIGNTRAINFYTKAGFKIIGSHKFYVTETYYNLNHQMFLNLLERKVVIPQG